MRKIGVLALALLALYSFAVDKTGPKLPKELHKHYVLIPAGKVNVDKDSVTIDKSFYLSSTEVSNVEYREFLNAVKNKADIYADAQIDSARWADKLTYDSPYVKYYHTHPAYDDFPVVNISHKGAEMYCQWLTQKVRQETGLNVTFRLPTRAEWIRAANGDMRFATYAWKGCWLRMGKGKFRGHYLCNFTGFGAENIHYDQQAGKYEIKKDVNWGPGEFNQLPDDASYITAPVDSYWPSEWGLYNMNGNVAEMVTADSLAVGGSWHSTGYDVRNQSVVPFTGPSPTVGFRVLMEVE
jgi:formylglycine-generating enzyme required for sulfatase activity